MPEVSTSTLDHLVFLVPTGALDEEIKLFQKMGFNVIPGGAHADGLTVNALIVLQDHVYIELISFISTADPEKRESHRWGQKEPGWIDYAGLGPGAEGGNIADTINRRSREDATNVSYLNAVPGGRTRHDGKELKWEITIPDPKHGVGSLPFFCADITPRLWRVPLEPAANTQHPNGVLGIAYVRILCTAESFSSLLRQFETVLGSSPSPSAIEGSSDSAAAFILTTPNSKAPKLVLSTPRDEEEVEEARKGAYIHDVGLYIQKGNDVQSIEISVRNGKANLLLKSQ